MLGNRYIFFFNQKKIIKTFSYELYPWIKALSRKNIIVYSILLFFYDPKCCLSDFICLLKNWKNFFYVPKFFKAFEILPKMTRFSYCILCNLSHTKVYRQAIKLKITFLVIFFSRKTRDRIIEQNKVCLFKIEFRIKNFFKNIFSLYKK